MTSLLDDDIYFEIYHPNYCYKTVYFYLREGIGWQFQALNHPFSKLPKNKIKIVSKFILLTIYL